MRSTRTIRSLSVPIVLASIAVPLSITLLVGWTLLVVHSAELPENRWLLVFGALAFVVIMAVLVTFAIFLVRELLEVRRQASFIDSVTHELKSPLASLKLCLETLGREGIDQQQRQVLHGMMAEDVARLNSFIDDILQASRLTHDRVEVELTDVDLGELVKRSAAAATLRAKVPSEAIQLDVDSGTHVSADRAALEIIVKNLIDNALKYSPNPPKVWVRTRRRAGGETVLEVQDRGIGIPRKHLKRVFHRFYRVNSEAVRARRGTGLGLFVVSALVRNLGGRIEADSDGEDHGTTFRVILPQGTNGSSPSAELSIGEASHE
jgi:signal transduction histidine kinase